MEFAIETIVAEITNHKTEALQVRVSFPREQTTKASRFRIPK